MMTTLIVDKRGTEQRGWQRGGMWHWIDTSVCAHSRRDGGRGVKMDVHRNCCHAQGHVVGEKQWRVAVRDAKAVVNWRGKRLCTLQGKRRTKALSGSGRRRGAGRLGSNWRWRRQSVLAWTVVVSTVTAPVIGALMVDTGLGQTAALLPVLLLLVLQKVINLHYEGLHSILTTRWNLNWVAWVCQCVSVPLYLCIENWLGISLHSHRVSIWSRKSLIL